MKCPKCHYLSFDPEPRCRNCGFSLGLEAPDLPMSKDEAADAPLDLELRSAVPPGPTPAMPLMGQSASASIAPEPVPARPVRRVPVPRLERPRTRLDAEERESASAGPANSGPETAAPAPEVPLSASLPPVPTAPPVAAARVAPPPTTELPLFVKGLNDVAPAITAPVEKVAPAPVAVPSAPSLAVPPVSAPELEAAREPDPIPIASAAPAGHAQWSAESQAPSMWSANRRRLGPLDRDLLSGVERIEKNEEKKAREKVRAARLPDAAGAGRRLAAAVVDGLLLSGILAGLLAVTLRWTAIEWTNLPDLPLAPTVAFLTLVAAGYLLLFTAFAGQTPGKMLVGIRVVGAGTNGDGSEPLSASQACLRELAAVPAVLLLGLGFLPALVGNERGVHDRIASTRVVRG